MTIVTLIKYVTSATDVRIVKMCHNCAKRGVCGKSEKCDSCVKCDNCDKCDKPGYQGLECERLRALMMLGKAICASASSHKKVKQLIIMLSIIQRINVRNLQDN